MNRLSVLLILVLYATACRNPHSSNGNSNGYDTVATDRWLYTALTTRYIENNSDSLDPVFADWNRLLQPNSKAFIEQDEQTKAVYAVFKAFYKPHDLLKLGKLEVKNKLNAHSRYVVVQDKIYYSVSGYENPDSGYNVVAKDSIFNFRPPVDVPENEVLYLNPGFALALQNFISNNQLTSTGQSNTTNIDNAERRGRLIWSYIPISHGHSDSRVRVATFPYVEHIIFNSTFTRALIEFRVRYEGGKALLRKENGQWRIEKSEATWIE